MALIERKTIDLSLDELPFGDEEKVSLIDFSKYYCKGAGFSDLFNNPEHFMHDIKKVKPEADALAYIYNILLSDEPLQGAHGHYLNTNFSCPSAAIKSSKVDQLVDRQKQFLNRLDAVSIEYQTEKKELDELIHFQKKINRTKENKKSGYKNGDD